MLMTTFDDRGVGINMPGRKGGKPKKQVAIGDFSTFNTNAKESREMPNPVTPGDTSMRHDQRYGKRDKAEATWPLVGMLGDKL